MSPYKTNLYVQVVNITGQYLGPAADRFVARQVRNHLDKEPDELNRRDLDKLIDWLKLSMAFLTTDSEIVDDYTKRLEKLITANVKSYESTSP